MTTQATCHSAEGHTNVQNEQLSDSSCHRLDFFYMQFQWNICYDTLFVKAKQCMTLCFGACDRIEMLAILLPPMILMVCTVPSTLPSVMNIYQTQHVMEYNVPWSLTMYKCMDTSRVHGNRDRIVQVPRLSYTFIHPSTKQCINEQVLEL